ncbi:hypothetical protein DB30_02313 [Enhygromyxa salina]|uniref:BNR repeat domain protein n=1 Tax=Enhygromyxa salina TaxID=215803 RepID=A0A0C1ZM04_9BACT|nr:hypothetical protein [Enhygromyxa salina]KIG11888.1 hypothetical protein DB30_02313 [Enhygromyxa salina]
MARGAKVLIPCSFALVACYPWGRAGISEIDVGVDVRVDAIIFVPERNGGLFAAVSGGAVVDHDGQRWDLSDHALRASSTDDLGRYWVCGDHGYLAFTDIDPAQAVEPTWFPVTTGDERDLYAIVADTDHVVVVGDEVLLVGTETDGAWEWSEPPVPSEGWGRLRGVSQLGSDDAKVFLAVGHNGRALLSPEGADTWTPVDGLDPDIDFNHLCGNLALGDDLVRAWWTADGWSIASGDGDADFVGCGGGFVLSSDRWISEFGDKGLERLYRLPWQPRAIDQRFGLLVGGDSGHVAWWSPGHVGEY